MQVDEVVSENWCKSGRSNLNNKQTTKEWLFYRKPTQFYTFFGFKKELYSFIVVVKL